MIRRNATRGSRALLLSALLLVAFGSLATAAQAASPGWRVLAATGPTHLPPEGEGTIVAYATNVGGAATNGSLIELTVGPLPAGFKIAAPGASGQNWTCPAAIAQQTVTCTRTGTIALQQALVEGFVSVPIEVEAGAPASAEVEVSIEGGGALPDPEGRDSYLAALTVSSAPAPAGIAAFWAGAFDENGRSLTQAGDHPHSAATMFLINTNMGSLGKPVPAGDIRDVIADLPPGFVGNPTVTDRCPNSLPGSCQPLETTVGSNVPLVQEFPATVNNSSAAAVSNDLPPTGYAALFTSKIVEAKIAALASVRSDDDYGVTVTAPQIPPAYTVYGTLFALQGNPPAAHGKAFLTTPTGCANEALNPPVTILASNAWSAPSLFGSQTVGIPPVTNCEALEFGTEEVPVDFSITPEATGPAKPSAATAKLEIDQSRLTDPDELATPHLKRSVVELPEGFTPNPAVADGLKACSTEQIGLITTNGAMPNPIRFDKSSPKCPDASKIGTAEIVTPLLDEPLNGVVYQAAQGDNPFNSLLAIYLVIDDKKTGTIVKLPGRVDTNDATGQLSATFDHNPQLPFSELTLRFRGGDRSVLATPDTCGNHTVKGTWTPWSAPESGPPAETSSSFAISGPGCPSAKAQRPLNLGFSAGATIAKAGAHSPFTLRLARPDGNQEFDQVEVSTPPGFAATLKGVATCSWEAVARAQSRAKGTEEIADPSCPANSQVGTTTVGAGVGPNPIYVKTGKAYLTGPYKGAPISFTFIVPAVAGPFDLGVQVVRTALHVDPVTAQVSAKSDSIPRLLKGIPVLIKDIRVAIDREAFTLNPTSCEAMSVSAKVSGASGASADLSSRFQVGECAALGFKPQTSIQLFGGIHRAKYQGVRAVVRPRPGDANIAGATVRFPSSAFVAQEHLQNICTRVQWAADACPKSSVYGVAEAISPLLDEPLKGKLHLRSSNNLLPDLVADLRGPEHQPIRVEVAVRNDSVKGALRNTVTTAPDAPVTYFRMQVFGGKKALIVNSRNICKDRNAARVSMRAHNGRSSVSSVPVRNAKCGKWRKAQKRKAKAAKRKRMMVKRAAAARRG